MAIFFGSQQGKDRPIDILSFGEPLVGFYPMEGTEGSITSQANRMVPLKTYWIATWGGDTSNVVLAASKLGLSCAYLTRVGQDPFGEGFLSLWESSGIQTDFVQKDPHHSTGLYFVSFREGKHVLTYFRKDSAAAHIDPRGFDLSILSSVKILHLSGISLAISLKAQEFSLTLMKAAREQGTLVCFDTNYRPALWGNREARQLMEQIIPTYVQILATTDEEMELLGWGKDPERLAYLLPGPSYYLVKQGSKGAYVRSMKEEVFSPSFSVPVKDTVGAGDAFDAGFLWAFLHSVTLKEAVRYASAVAALVCTGQGPLEKQPTHQEVESFLRNHH
ncbi:MAG: sugar kinase [Spirochaetes bacterium]|nr:sugar kinase [Spirochaetota bacterium]